jgi:hypothetical protein
MRRPLHNAPEPAESHPVAEALGSPESMLSGILDKLAQLGIDVAPYEVRASAGACRPADAVAAARLVLTP